MLPPNGGSGWEGGHPSGLTALFFLPGDSRDLGRKSGQVVVSRAGGSARSLLRLQPPREGWGSAQGAVAEQSGGLLRLPPGGWYHHPGWEQRVSSLAALCFSPPPALPGAAADPDACGEGWGRGQHPQRAPLPGPGAGAAPCRGGSRRPRAGGRAPCPPAWPSSEPFLYLDHAHQLQGFQGRKVSIRGVRLILIPGPQNLLF